MLTTSGMPALSVTDSTGFPITLGCDEIVGDSLTPTNLWMAFNGNVYFSSNTGASFTTTCYPAQAAGSGAASNGLTKGMGHTIAVDPANSSIVYMSTPSSSIYRTVDKGATCQAANAATIITPTSSGGVGGGYLIAFDSSGGTTSTCPNSASVCTKNIYVSSYGTGVYKSTDGGATWTLTPGTPTTHLYMTADPTGVLWFVDTAGSPGVARKFNGTWSAVSFSGSTQIQSVAYDPNNCTLTSNCHIAFAIASGAGNIAMTVNGGSTWAVTTSKTVTTTDVPWVASYVTALGFYPSGAIFDNSGQFYTGGEGVFFTTPPTTNGSTVAWTSKTAGIEEFESTQIVTSPGTSGKLLIAGWDVGCFALTAPYNTFPGDAQHGCANPNQNYLEQAYSIDWAAPSPATFVSLVDNETGYRGGTYHSQSGISTNSGSTWATFSGTNPNTNVPANVGTTKIAGCMAAASTTNFLWGPTDGSNGAIAPNYTTDGGATWNPITVTGATVTQGWPWIYYENSHQCAADRVTANQFYIYNWNTGTGGDAIISCASSGASCTVASRPGLGPSEQYNPTLKAVPGRAGYLFLSYGILTSPPDTGAANGFYYYTDAGVTKNTIANATGVTAFGFGAPFPGHTFPAIVFSGYYNGVYGLWRSIDWDTTKTWQQIGTYPLNLPLVIMDIDGDKSVPGVFYYGTGSGVICGALSASQCNGTT
jgi:hypothetical protein